MQDNATNYISSRGNQAYVFATTHLYDEWIRDNYDLQVWQNYLKLGTQDKHFKNQFKNVSIKVVCMSNYI
jgi:hypothetical protein